MKLRALGLVVASAMIAAACGGGEIVIGDDTSLAGPDGGDPYVLPEGGMPDTGGPSDAGSDTSMPPVPGACGLPNQCQKNGTPCRAKDATGLTCKADEFCCATTCPTLSPPAPTFCDGGPYAALYDSGGCVVGYACTPVTCATAGGSCVGLAPGTCPSNHVGDATKYSCGGGLGTQCCLP